MPVSQFDKAFTLLEQSFKDASFLQAYKALPLQQPIEHAESSRQVDLSDDDDDDDDNGSVYSDASMHQGYRPRDAPSISLMRRNSTLPPTPPTQSRNTSATHTFSAPLPEDKAGANTPPNQQKPPTPDLTPPNPRIKELAPPRPHMPPSLSSRAESFMTARETQSRASDNNSQASLPLQPDSGHKWLEATRGMRLGSMQFPESESSNFLRNVTIRKKRAGVAHQQTTPSQKRCTSSHKIAKPTTMAESEDTNDSPSTIKDGETLEWPETANDNLYRHLRDEKSKRLSNASNTSTIVEAFVLADPPHHQRQPGLRRVSRVDTLRDDASSRRTSIASQHSMNHRMSHLPGRNLSVNGEFDAARSVSNPETGHLTKVPVIVIPERRSSRSSGSGVAHAKTHMLTSRQNRLHHPKNHVSLNQDYNQGETSLSSLGQHSDLHSDVWLDIAAPDRTIHKPRTTLRHVSAPVRTDFDSGLKTTASKDAFRRINGLDAKIDISHKQGWKRHSTDAELESPELERPPRKSIDQVRTTNYSLLLPSGKRNSSTQALYDYSLQSSPRQSSDTKDFRHLQSIASPLSQLLDQTDSMEVDEAKVVNLYLHGNKSLHLVQDVAKERLAEAEKMDGEKQTDDSSAPDGGDLVRQASRPVFQAVVKTPTPPTIEDQNRLERDSPLRNPRAAPQPPSLPDVIIIPATPVSSYRNTPTPTSPSPPPRRPSLVEKARRYSENLIQPFLPASMSRRNSVSSQRPQSAEDRDTTLHPFWRPRGFWDDFTDSEDEDFEDEPLPQGGDTSEVQSLESVEEQQQRRRSWRPRRLFVLLPGFRGQGGSMLGNSLGIDRHGTNNHRPQVSVTSLDSLENSPTPTRRPTFLARLFTVPSLKKRKSTDLLRIAAHSTESLRRLSQRQRRRKWRNWDWNLGGLRKKMIRRRERRDEVQREKKREGMKARIGLPVQVEA